MVPDSDQTPPLTVQVPVVDVIHGVPVTDPYRWLEGDVSAPTGPQRVTPDVAAWTDAQNAYTRSVLDRLPGRQAIETRLRSLMEVGTVTAPLVRASRFFYTRREGTQDQPVHYWREGPEGADHVLIDPSRIDGTGLTAIEWVSPSPDGRLVAYGAYRSGDENTTLRLREVDTGRDLPLEIPGKTQAPDWLPDGSGFVYRNLRDAADPYSSQLLFHRLEDPVTDDAVLFRQYTAEEDAVLATTWGPFGSLSRDGRWLVLGYWVDTRSNDLWLADFEAYRRTGRLDKRIVSVGQVGQAEGTVIEDVLYLQTTKGAPRGRVLALDTAAPDLTRAATIVPERVDAVIEDVSFGAGCLAVTYLRHAANTIEVFDLIGDSRGTMALPGIGSAIVHAEADRSDAFVTFTSFNYPTTIFSVDLARPTRPGTVWAQPAAPVDPTSVNVEQVWYPSKDGTPISMFLVHRHGLLRTGRTPTLLYGYGGFNVSLTPAFAPTLFQWFEAGGLYAVPNLRGGGEYGDAWHEAGILDHKQNVFDDFIAAAEWLIEQRYTSSSVLAMAGGSNGGLLTGAVMAQRPDLCRAVISAVPLLDMLRYDRFLMARYWVPEYGSAEDRGQFEVLRAYSPYHRVSDGTAYPAVLLTAGEHDARVHALHARKMAARLQAATTSDPVQQPVLLWIDRDAGHGQGKPLSLRLRDVADQRVFLMWQLGLLPADHLAV